MFSFHLRQRLGLGAALALGLMVTGPSRCTPRHHQAERQRGAEAESSVVDGS